MKQLGFFDEARRIDKLTELVDSLECLNQVMDWNMFAPILNRVFAKKEKGIRERPSYNYVMIFKILILQQIYNISEDQSEYQINDRMSFMRFLGLSLEETVPDAKTIWLFRDMLTKADVIIKLFNLFIASATKHCNV